MKKYEAKETVLCGACANYNPDLGRGMIGHSTRQSRMAYGDQSRMADHAPAQPLPSVWIVYLLPRKAVGPRGSTDDYCPLGRRPRGSTGD